MSGEVRYRLVVLGVGAWQAALAAGTLVGVLWALALDERITTKSPVLHVYWAGPDFTVSAMTASLLLAGAAGAAGSLVHTISVFSARVGRHTFEQSYAWWYLLRPFAASLLAVLFVAAVRAGEISLGAAAATAPALALVAGGLAGLFTDRVLQRMRALLGATSVETAASKQKVPHAAPPEPQPAPS